ncbi:MAG: ATP-binding protein [Clostridia bacterium]|nr:ATP-binding protein [Clostridia bacterium]
MIFEVENYAAMREALEKLCYYLAENDVPSERVFDSKLVASELVGNVLRHSGGVAKLCGEITEEFIELVILSSMPFLPPKASARADVFAEHGRGLFLVDSVCEERSLTDEGGIKVRIRIRESK